MTFSSQHLTLDSQILKLSEYINDVDGGFKCEKSNFKSHLSIQNSNKVWIMKPKCILKSRLNIQYAVTSSSKPQ